MTQQWLPRRMKEICDISSSRRIRAHEYQESGVPFYRGKEIIEKHNGALKVSTDLFISQERFQEVSSKSGAPSAGDLLLTSVGTLGIPYVVQPGERFYFKDGNLTWFRSFNGVVSSYLYYWLLSPSGKAQLKRCTIGSSQPAFTIALLKEIEIDVPPLDIQQRIASVLSAYDHLIENNTRRIEILEEMARRLYEEWFVQFRFPGHDSVNFQDSVLGKIPRGWHVNRLEDVVAVNPRTKVPKDGEKWFVPMSSLSESAMIISGLEKKSGNSGAKFQNGDTLVARITPCLENGKTGFVDFLTEEQPTACGSTEFIVLRSISLCPEMVYLLARSERFRDVAIKSMSGATGRQRVRVESLMALPVVQPDDATLAKFQRIVAPCFRQARTLALKNANLIAQRDLLLPKLISGEIDVSNILSTEDMEG